MISFPNCKINLGLYVTNRREDGYHDIETVFYPLALHDVLEVVPSVTSRLHLSGIPIAGDLDNNLVWKAYHLLKQRFPDRIKPLDIYLHKVIPMGAGLGGGSANGAYMLRLLNDYFNLGIDLDQLIDLALLLGSDCPFFIQDMPHFATGRGESMVASTVDLSPYSIQLFYPGLHIATAKAFAMIQPKAASYDLRKLNELPVAEWKDHISNDFEPSIFSIHPALKEIKQQLYEQGALYTSMTGSGSAIYAIFEKNGRVILGGVETFYIA